MPENQPTRRLNLDENGVIAGGYDTDGNLIWGTQFGSDKADRGYDVTANAAGEVYVVGSTSGDLAGISNPGAPYRSGGFLTKLDSNGAILAASSQTKKNSVSMREPLPTEHRDRGHGQRQRCRHHLGEHGYRYEPL